MRRRNEWLGALTMALGVAVMIAGVLTPDFYLGVFGIVTFVIGAILDTNPSEPERFA